MKVLVLTDTNVRLKPEDYAECLKSEDWKTNQHIMSALEKLGHEPKILGIFDDLDPLLHALRENKPDVVFNLSEGYRADRSFEPHVAALFELMDVPYTGAKLTPLNLCKDKGLAKKILSYHRIRVPKFLISHKSRPLRTLGGFEFPVFIKPLNFEASEGISQLSLAENAKDALDRVNYLHEKLGADVIIEEYIDGREIYVGVIGNERLEAFPPRELFFTEVPEGEPRFATFRAKWDDNYRKKWGITTGPAKPFAEGVEEKILETSKKIFRLLHMNGYGRIDLRVKESGEIVFLEANPNPEIAKDEDFALAAIKAGYDYKGLVAKILKLAGT